MLSPKKQPLQSCQGQQEAAINGLNGLLHAPDPAQHHVVNMLYSMYTYSCTACAVCGVVYQPNQPSCPGSPGQQRCSSVCNAFHCCPTQKFWGEMHLTETNTSLLPDPSFLLSCLSICLLAAWVGWTALGAQCCRAGQGAMNGAMAESKHLHKSVGISIGIEGGGNRTRVWRLH